MGSNTLYTLAGFVLLNMQLQKDHMVDKGRHKKAKIFQTIVLSLIVATYASALRYPGYLLRHFDKAFEKFGASIGLVPGHLHFKIFLLHVVLMIAALVLAFLMARRNQKARQMFLYLLPFLALAEAFGFYRGWLGEDNGPYDQVVAFLFGLILFGGMATGIILIYRTKLMDEFFDRSTNAN